MYLTATSSFVFLSLTNLATPKFPEPSSFNGSYLSSIPPIKYTTNPQKRKIYRIHRTLPEILNSKAKYRLMKPKLKRPRMDYLEMERLSNKNQLASNLLPKRRKPERVFGKRRDVLTTHCKLKTQFIPEANCSRVSRIYLYISIVFL